MAEDGNTMDSRIREIEQRLGRAKEGLAEGGREDYLKQLYLLDAEIRAVIRDNGSLPEHLRELLREAPRPRRRTALPATGMALALLLVVAAATYAVAWYAQDPAAGAAEAGHALADQPAGDEAAAGAGAAPGGNPALERVSNRLASLRPPWRDATEPGATAPADSPADAPADEAAEAAAARPAAAPTRPAQADQRRPAVQPPADAAEITVAVVPPLLDTPEHGGVAVASHAREHQPGANPLDQPNMFATQLAAGFNWTIARFALPVEDENKDQEIAVVGATREQQPPDDQPDQDGTGESTVVDKQLSTTEKKVDN